MSTCRICHVATERDDVVLHGPAGSCICLRCYSRETGTARAMPTALRRALTVVLAELDRIEQPA